MQSIQAAAHAIANMSPSLSLCAVDLTGSKVAEAGSSKQ